MRNEMHYVYEVYQKGSFSKAAESLFISQPALSVTIKKLESELGTPLFDRSTNPIHLTPAGEFYIKASEEIMTIEKAMHSYFNNLTNLESGTLTISTSTFFCCYSLPIHLKPFIHKHPGLQINFIESHDNEKMEYMLRTGDTELVLSSNPTGLAAYDRQYFVHEHLILAVPRNYEINDSLSEYQLTYQDIIDGKHTQTDCPKISLVHFKNQPFLSLQQGSELYHRSQFLFQNAGISPQIYMYLDQLPTAYFMVWHGYGVSIIRDSTLHIVPPPTNNGKDVVFYKIDDNLASRNIYFYYKNSPYLSPVARAFLAYTAQTCKEPDSQL